MRELVWVCSSFSIHIGTLTSQSICTIHSIVLLQILKWSFIPLPLLLSLYILWHSSVWERGQGSYKKKRLISALLLSFQTNVNQMAYDTAATLYTVWSLSTLCRTTCIYAFNSSHIKVKYHLGSLGTATFEALQKFNLCSLDLTLILFNFNVSLS